MAKSGNDKTFALVLFFIAAFLCIILRLVYLQVICHGFYKELSSDQRTRFVELLPDRGDIMDRNGSLLATSVEKWSIYVRPRAIKTDKQKIMNALCRKFKGSSAFIAAKFAKNSNFWLARKTEKSLADFASSLECTGIDVIKEKKRIYPKGHLASQLIGFAGLDNKGLMGIELGLDEFLTGVPGKFMLERDIRGREIATANTRQIQAPLDGMNVYLTIDEALQYKAQKDLSEAVRRTGSVAGSITIMDIKSGDILAVAGYPDFDPNIAGKFTPVRWKLSPVTDIYEPGSTFKVITCAAGIDEGIFEPDSKIPCPDELKIGGITVKNSHKIVRDTPFKTLRDVLAESLNTGTAFVGLKLGPYRFFKYISGFGFGARTGIEYPGERKGMVSAPQDWTKSDNATFTFGQSLAVTPLQLVTAVAAIGNGGIRVKPQIIRKIESPDEDIVRTSFPREEGRVISQATAKKVTDLMMGVAYMKHGSGRKAKMSQFSVAVKTGTAQKPAPGGGYLKGHYYASMVGFVPARSPRIAILIILDDPKTSIWGETTAAPVFSSVGEFALRYLNAAPDL